MPANTTKRKQEAAGQFASLLADSGITPEALLVAVMAGDEKITKADGSKVEITDRMYQAAKDLIPFRLPRLNSIDADVRNVDLTHEEWLASLDEEDDKDDGGTYSGDEGEAATSRD